MSSEIINYLLSRRRFLQDIQKLNQDLLKVSVVEENIFDLSF